MNVRIKTVIIFLLSATMISCKGKSDGGLISSEGLEIAQQVGDFMVSVDEFGAGNSSIALQDKSIRTYFDRYAPNEMSESLFSKLFLPEAWAASCSAATYSNCSGSQRVKNFTNCTVGSATFSGSVTLNWSTACSIASVGQYATRNPNLTVTGRLGSTLKITKTGTDGQRLQMAAAGPPKVYNFTSDGINRRFTDANNSVRMDFTTTTVSPITITGGDRNGRVIANGSIQIRNNINSVTCTYSPNNVRWTSDCNCPVSGSWSGSCSDGHTASVVLSGCGTATVSYDDVSESITFDRCGN